MPGQKFPSHNLHQIHLCDFSFDPGSVCDMVVNLHRNTDVRMSHHVLNDLHIQIRLCHPCTGRMPPSGRWGNAGMVRGGTSAGQGRTAGISEMPSCP